MQSKVSADDVFMHYFQNMTPAYRVSEPPPLDPLGDFRLQNRVICPPREKKILRTSMLSSSRHSSQLRCYLLEVSEKTQNSPPGTRSHSAKQEAKPYIFGLKACSIKARGVGVNAWRMISTFLLCVIRKHRKRSDSCFMRLSAL